MNTYRVHAYNPTTGKISITQVDKNTMEEAVSFVMETLLPIHKLLKVELLNEYKNWVSIFQAAITPVSGRVETGPLKINDDWCGYFVRGDNAVGISIDAVQLEEWFKTLPYQHSKNIWITMNTVISFLKEMSACRNK